MSKKKIIKKVLKYIAVFEPAIEGGYIVSIPTLPGCMSQGDTFEDAKEMIQDAITGYLEVMKKEKEEIPQETSETVVATITVPYPSYLGA